MNVSLREGGRFPRGRFRKGGKSPPAALSLFWIKVSVVAVRLLCSVEVVVVLVFVVLWDVVN